MASKGSGAAATFDARCASRSTQTCRPPLRRPSRSLRRRRRARARVRHQGQRQDAPRPARARPDDVAVPPTRIGAAARGAPGKYRAGAGPPLARRPVGDGHNVRDRRRGAVVGRVVGRVRRDAHRRRHGRRVLAAHLHRGRAARPGDRPRRHERLDAARHAEHVGVGESRPVLRPPTRPRLIVPQLLRSQDQAALVQEPAGDLQLAARPHRAPLQPLTVGHLRLPRR